MKLQVLLFTIIAGSLTSQAIAQGYIDNGSGGSPALRMVREYYKSQQKIEVTPCVTENPLGCAPSVQTMQNAFVALVVNNRFTDAEDQLIQAQILADGPYNEYYWKVLSLRDAILEAQKKGSSIATLHEIVTRVDLKNIRETSLRTNAVIWFVDHAAKTIQNFPKF